MDFVKNECFMQCAAIYTSDVLGGDDGGFEVGGTLFGQRRRRGGI